MVSSVDPTLSTVKLKKTAHPSILAETVQRGVPYVGPAFRAEVVAESLNGVLQEPMGDLASSEQKLVAAITQMSNHRTTVTSQSHEIVCQKMSQLQQMIMPLSQRTEMDASVGPTPRESNW